MKHKTPHKARYGGMSRPHVQKDTPTSEKMAPQPGDTDMDQESGPIEPDQDDMQLGAAQGPSMNGRRFAR